jgi:hypothetical protein
MADPKYDADTIAMLMRNRLPFTEREAPVRKSKEPLPYNTAGLPNLLVREMPYLEGKNRQAFVLNSNRVADEQRNRGLQQNMFVNPKADAMTIAHEAEHLLARQNAGFSQMPRELFNTLVEQGGTKAYRAVPQFLNGLAEALPYLEQKYGIKNGYMDKDFIKEEGQVGLYEIFATLAGAEAALGVDLTKDPELRKTMFKDKAVREAYNAVTGLRQTRLDPRDLPPYTRVPEREPKTGMLNKVKSLSGMADGGYIEHAGNRKLI